MAAVVAVPASALRWRELKNSRLFRATWRDILAQSLAVATTIVRCLPTPELVSLQLSSRISRAGCPSSPTVEASTGLGAAAKQAATVAAKAAATASVNAAAKADAEASARAAFSRSNHSHSSHITHSIRSNHITHSSHSSPFTRNNLSCHIRTSSLPISSTHHVLNNLEES